MSLLSSSMSVYRTPEYGFKDRNFKWCGQGDLDLYPLHIKSYSFGVDETFIVFLQIHITLYKIKIKFEICYEGRGYRDLFTYQI